MKLVSFYSTNGLSYGVKTKDGLVDVQATAAKAGVPVSKDVEEVIAKGKEGLREVESVLSYAPVVVPEEEILYAPPVQNPGKIICVGANYRAHAKEADFPIPEFPIYFAKFANSLAAHEEEVVLPEFVDQGDYEVELVVVIGQKTHQVSPFEALERVFGYATGNDLSARKEQFRSNQWMFGKAIDGFAPLGPHLVTADEVPDPQNLTLKCWVNGELRQHANTKDMIFSVATIISDLSQIMTLEPGDVIYTGTPEGVILGMEHKEWLKNGDEIVCEVEGLGRLENRLVKVKNLEEADETTVSF
ncbi:fumarylacetoacetate hydrolase family protein [Planococcus sp. YIM B11945]|uniref:fumarylacetoacetate hydrolase family protein n=1 Tax=Planococcus sp. YIM B11945 TaxID=3435410 RepID=UPI003D7D5610